MSNDLQQKIKSQGGFLTNEDIRQLAKESRLTQVLIRCGGCRFQAAAHDAEHLIGIINRDDQDYVLDVSLPN